jgi:hypothetical protein
MVNVDPNINKVLGSMPDDIEKGGKSFKILPIFKNQPESRKADFFFKYSFCMKKSDFWAKFYTLVSF